MSDQEQQTKPDGGASVSTAGLGGDESERLSLTHACGCEYVGKDGTKRRMGAQRYSDNTISVHISTYWDGEDTEPTTTSMRIGVEAYSVLLDMLNVFAVDRERFRITDAATPNVDVTGPCLHGSGGQQGSTAPEPSSGD